MRFDYCRGWENKNLSLPEGIACPPNLEYPPPPARVELLFVGWNPPGEKHFWNSTEDNLYRNLTWVFEQLGWLKKTDIRAVFTEKCFYFTHAVKCWTEAKFDWHMAGLVDRCANNILKAEIENLNPKIICALGKLPHMALHSIWPRAIPSSIKYGEGWCEVVEARQIIVTCFPNIRWNRKKKTHNRQCTANALDRWIDGRYSSRG